MRKIIPILSAVLISQLFAISQDTAINLYKTKQYNKAYKAFYQLLEKNNYQSNILNLYFAKSAEKIGNYKEALGAIERILINNPHNIKAQYERAKLYYLMHNYIISKQYFKELEIQLKNNNLKNKVKSYLEQINDTNKNNLNLTLMLNMGYESNINNSSDISSYNVLINNTNTLIQNNQEIKSSYTFQEALLADYTHKFNNLNMDNNILFLSKQYTSQHTKDFQYFKYSPSLIFNFKNFKFNNKLNYGYLIYDNNHYLSTYGIESDISYKINNSLKNILTLKIDNMIYAQNENSNQNSTLYSVENTLTKKINNNSISILFGFNKNNRHSGNLENVNYKTYKTKLRDEFIFYSYIIDTYLQYEEKHYSDKYEMFNTYQKDKKTTFDLKLTKHFKLLDVQTEYKYINNNSNIAPFEYNKWNLSLNLIKKVKGL